MKSVILTLAVLAAFIPSSPAASHDTQSDTCSQLNSCASCITKTYCSWCVTKSKCTMQSCGSGNAIYNKRIRALMSGPGFCPRVVRPEKDLTLPNGKKHTFIVKLTQIHLYMAFTVWKCRISLDGEETVVNAALRADEVYCDSVVLSNKSDKPVEGSATVLWDNNKSFDGSLLFKVSL